MSGCVCEDHRCFPVFKPQGLYCERCYERLVYVQMLTAEANARLIAAAPELLEALRAIAGLGNLHPGDNQPLIYCEARRIARAVIEKVEARLK
jgi:hypothetical protein